MYSHYKLFVGIFIIALFCSCQKDTPITICTLEPIHGQFEDPRDGTVYPTIELCGTVWMAENLRYDTLDSKIDSSHSAPYHGGRLYNHFLARSVCPNGWHLSTDEEWNALDLLIGVDTAQLDSFYVNRGTEASHLKLKANSSLWTPIGNNLSGMNIYPTGFHYTSTSSHNYGDDIFAANSTAFFWTASEYMNVQVTGQYIARTIGQTGSQKTPASPSSGYACRCVQD